MPNKAIALVVMLLMPAHLYNNPDQPAMVTVQPAVAKIALTDAAGKKQAEAAIEKAGDFDLGKLLPAAWDGSFHYAQGLDKDGKAVGSALVIVPLWPPEPRVKAVLKEKREGKPMGLRIYPEMRGVLHTTEGDITLAFSPEVAPTTVKSFSDLIGGGLFTNVPFHRVVPGFVIQGGDPTGTGMGGPGYNIDLEASKKPHNVGTLSMARSQDPNSAGSQFFICLDREHCAQLDGGYAAFGDVVAGMDAVKKIAATPLADAGSGAPVKAPLIQTAELIPAPPRDVKDSAASPDRERK